MASRTDSWQTVEIQLGELQLEGDLSLPAQASGLVIFAHGSGSSRFSSRNRYVAEALNEQGLATLLFDLLTPSEHEIDQQTRELRFDIPLLSNRLVGVIAWAGESEETAGMPIGLFGASTGAAAALIAAAKRPDEVQAVVSRGGRPDLADKALPQVAAPTLMIVGGDDRQVLALNRQAAAQMHAPHGIEVIPRATHLFEEPGKLEEVARIAGDFFNRTLHERSGA